MRLYRDLHVPGRLDFDRDFYHRIAHSADRRQLVHNHIVPIRSGYAWPVKAGSVVRIVAVEGPQVCDLNLWHMDNPRERFWAARTRQLQGAHVTTLDRLWSCLPYLRPMVTITNDTLPTEPTANGGRCHDLLGSRCDPYLYKLLDDRDYDVTCHNNLSREIDLLCAISTCPSGDLSEWGWGPDQSDPVATCRPLGVEVYDLDEGLLEGWTSPQPVRVKSVYGA